MFTELEAKEKAVTLVRIGRAVMETCKGLDIIQPRFAVVIEQHDRPWVASNIMDKPELAGYLFELAQSLHHDMPIQMINVPKRMGPRESFVYTMRANRGNDNLAPNELACLVRTYLVGYLDAVLQFAGMKAATMILRDLSFASDPDWVPGEEWQYWKHELPIEAMRLPNGM